MKKEKLNTPLVKETEIGTARCTVWRGMGIYLAVSLIKLKLCALHRKLITGCLSLFNGSCTTTNSVTTITKKEAKPD